MSESSVQNNIKLQASLLGWRVWRNNLGVLKDERGIPIRFGLCNDSKNVNMNLKSGDLIGIKPVVITQDMVGSVIGQFVSLECKTEGWRYNENDTHQRAQMRWIEMIHSLGGYACFTTGELK